MSSVVIAGNTSGSITLSAPATAGTNTITLPAETGTLVTTATSSGISGSAITTGTVGVSVGGTGITTTTAYGVLAGGTTATGAFQNIGTGTATQVLTSNGPGVLPSWQAAAGGQLQTQIFTSPGTWTKPSSVTQVRVTVIGGGAGAGLVSNASYTGGSGGTSSFGPLVSATGGSGSPSPNGGSPGSGTVSAPATLLKTGAVYAPITYVGGSFPTAYQSLYSTVGVISGTLIVSGLTGSPTYSASGSSMAGGAGSNGTSTNYSTGVGGLAIGVVPVSGPVAVTVGTGGAFNPAVGNLTNGSAIGGAVVVEWVG